MLKSAFRLLFIIFFSMLLNGEYLAHGPSLFSLAPLVGFYLFYCIIIDNIVAVYNLNDRSLFLFGAIVGLFVEAFLNRSLYGDPFFAGVNLVVVLVMMMAWGFFATVLPLWLANKLLPRDTTSKHLRIIFGILGIVLLLGLFNFWAQNLEVLNEKGAGLMALFIFALVVLFILSIFRRRDYPRVVRTKFIYIFLIVYTVVQIVAYGFGDAIYVVYLLVMLPGSALIYFNVWRKHSFLLNQKQKR